MNVIRCTAVGMILATSSFLRAGVPPRANQHVTVKLPNYGSELRAFDAPRQHPVAWWPHVVNAGWGGGGGGGERIGGWLDRNWQLVDYLDRSGDYTTHTI